MAECDSKTGYNPAHVARSARVEIDAPASVVWEVLVDLPKYGEWNPFCVKCESTLEMGAPVNMTIASLWDPSELNVVTEYLCAFEPEKLLSWEMYWTEAWPYAGRRDQVIERLGPDRCAYYSTDAFLGDTAIHIVRFGMGWISAAFTATAHALKARAEAIYAEQRQKTVVNA
ncbi:MAG: hypothetical protein JWM91_832 [Rhodospirillales bacterium]|nr:hypothetical protein [Rhodospirillales bacterium]